MLKLVNIKKEYKLDRVMSVHALKGINLEFRANEFVSILGPSGCGKTTMLNIIGGLDRYTSGDLQVEGKSTKSFKDGDWDAYRNQMIGFVFQSYNLISHLTVLENVAISMTLAGIGAEERKRRATEALEAVQLSDQLHKRPSQLSGGQMQRVAIARALVNNPRILLADEPTGALDSVTSVQIMNILKNVAKDRLVIMVTHNQELADEYSDRVIRLLDGEVLSDSNPVLKQTTELAAQPEKLKQKKTSMSFFTALKLSFRNLLTKKARTIITSIAGSIGIIGIALVLAISNGMSIYVDNMQSDALAGFPLTIGQTATSSDMLMSGGQIIETAKEFPEDNVIFSHDSAAAAAERRHTNILTQGYLDYLDQMDTSLYNSIAYTRGLEMHAIAKGDDNIYRHISMRQSTDIMAQIMGMTSLFSELPPSQEFVESQYDLLGSSTYPSNDRQIVLIIDSFNRVDITLLNSLGITVEEKYTFEDLIGKTVRVVDNNSYYTQAAGAFTPKTSSADLQAIYQSADAITLTICGVMRIKETATSGLISSSKLGYLPSLTDYMLTRAQTSDIALAQKNSPNNIVLSIPSYGIPAGAAFEQLPITHEDVMKLIGAETIPVGILIYPKNFESKEQIKAYLDKYNVGKLKVDQIHYTDLADIITGMISTMIGAIAIVLGGFAAISLVVSSIMIGIITYVSVVERTKEIGILRSVGARKKDIGRVFNAEAIIIGFISGVIGIVFTFIACFPLSVIFESYTEVPNLASLPPIESFLLVLLSMACTLLAGLLPSSIASKRDPVAALRSE